jgi:two-component system LytT family sensor kinase
VNNKINKYQLKLGFVLAAGFPGIFVFSKPVSSSTEIIIQFLTFFTYILILWIFNFSIIDFKTRSQLNHTSRSRFLRISFSFVFSVALYLFLAFVAKYFIDVLASSTPEKHVLYAFRPWFFLCLRILLSNAFILLIKYLFDISEEKQQIRFENEMLKTENLNALHETLKQQLNPHFLFNSLSTLKSLIRTNQVQSIKFIEELSSVYRYMLFHQNQKQVHVQEEIKFLESYLFLLKIRFEEAIFTSIEIPDEVFHYMMPPNTLQLLIENAVKHNAVSSKKPLFISIFTRKDWLVVENNLHPKPASSPSSNLGLKNISSRYQLLKGKDIIIRRSEQCFQVLLPLQ